MSGMERREMEMMNALVDEVTRVAATETPNHSGLVSQRFRECNSTESRHLIS